MRKHGPLVAQQLAFETGLSFTAGEVVMSCGAAGGINIVLKTVLNPGEEVIIFASYFAEYIYYVDNHSGICRVVASDDRFSPDLPRPRCVELCAKQALTLSTAEAASQKARDRTAASRKKKGAQVPQA